MPPRRSNPRRSAASASKPQPSKAQSARYARQSDESIHTAFSTYAIPSPRRRRQDPDEEEEDEEEHGGHPHESRVIRLLDVGRALTAADLPRPPAGFLDDYADSDSDSDNSDGADEGGSGGSMTWRHFLALARTMRETAQDEADEDDDEDMEDAAFEDDAVDVDDDDGDEEEEEYEEDQPKSARKKQKTAAPTPAKAKPKAKASPKTKAKTAATSKAEAKTGAAAKGKRKKTAREVDAEEVDAAFSLFTHGRHASSKSAGGAVADGRITLADLRRVARELKEDVDDKMLKMMIEEANGEPGAASVGRGVGREDFEGVMKRAGVFG